MRTSIQSIDRHEFFPKWPLIAFAGSLTILSLLYITLAFLGLLDRPDALPDTGMPSPSRIVVGDVPLTVPQDLIRFDHQRVNGALSRLDLEVTWPMGAVSSTGANSTQTIFISITPKDDALPPVARVSQVYQRFLQPQIESGPAGLAMRRFMANSGYDDELLYYDPTRPGNYFVRCAPSAGLALPSCLRDVRLGDKVDVVYRFPFPLLKDWRSLENNMRALLSAIGVPEE